MTTILSILNGFLKNHGKVPFFAAKWISKIPPHLAYVATLPSETLMSAKQAIKDKLQGSVATYLRCGEVANNQIQIKKGLLLSMRVKKLKSVNSYKQKHECLVHFCVWPTHC